MIKHLKVTVTEVWEMLMRLEWQDVQVEALSSGCPQCFQTYTLRKKNDVAKNAQKIVALT